MEWKVIKPGLEIKITRNGYGFEASMGPIPMVAKDLKKINFWSPAEYFSVYPDLEDMLSVQDNILSGIQKCKDFWIEEKYKKNLNKPFEPGDYNNQYYIDVIPAEFFTTTNMSSEMFIFCNEDHVTENLLPLGLVEEPMILKKGSLVISADEFYKKYYRIQFLGKLEQDMEYYQFGDSGEKITKFTPAFI